MTDTTTALRARAANWGVVVPPAIEPRIIAYFDLLFRWNAKINLTALSDQNAAMDRLLIEPLAAAAALPHHTDLIDLGSGGGSPAIPLALVLDARRLVMVESKSRKAAFLREAARSVGINGTVENARFEDVAMDGVHNGQMALVTIRAVRVDLQTLTVAKGFLKPGGFIALFSPTASSPSDLPRDLRVVNVMPLIAGSHLVVLGR